MLQKSVKTGRSLGPNLVLIISKCYRNQLHQKKKKVLIGMSTPTHSDRKLKESFQILFPASSLITAWFWRLTTLVNSESRHFDSNKNSIFSHPRSRKQWQVPVTLGPLTSCPFIPFLTQYFLQSSDKMIFPSQRQYTHCFWPVSSFPKGWKVP